MGNELIHGVQKPSAQVTNSQALVGSKKEMIRAKLEYWLREKTGPVTRAHGDDKDILAQKQRLAEARVRNGADHGAILKMLVQTNTQ